MPPRAAECLLGFCWRNPLAECTAAPTNWPRPPPCSPIPTQLKIIHSRVYAQVLGCWECMHVLLMMCWKRARQLSCPSLPLA